MAMANALIIVGFTYQKYPPDVAVAEAVHYCALRAGGVLMKDSGLGFWVFIGERQQQALRSGPDIVVNSDLTDL